MRYLEINLTKYVQHLLTEYYKTWLRELNFNKTNENIYHIPVSEESLLLRYQFSLNSSYRVSVVSTKISAEIFSLEIDKFMLKFI